MNAEGYLIIIGGAEDKTGDSVVLKQAVSMMSGSDRLAILTTAATKPKEVGANYKNVFYKLGLSDVLILNIQKREEANNANCCEMIEKSKCVFMTGGDQLRITSIIGGTRAAAALTNLYVSGGIIMGTSAGASVMSSTMIVNGKDNEPARKCTLKMAPGLGFLDGVIIDQHFDQRGRFGRLLCGVAENPEVLGIGIDEDTSIKVYPDGHFIVAGSNSVTVIDGSTVTFSNVTELNQNETIAISGLTVHMLPCRYGFDLKNRKVLHLEQ